MFLIRGLPSKTGLAVNETVILQALAWRIRAVSTLFLTPQIQLFFRTQVHAQTRSGDPDLTIFFILHLFYDFVSFFVILIFLFRLSRTCSRRNC